MRRGSLKIAKPMAIMMSHEKTMTTKYFRPLNGCAPFVTGLARRRSPPLALIHPALHPVQQYLGNDHHTEYDDKFHRVVYLKHPVIPPWVRLKRVHLQLCVMVRPVPRAFA